MSEPFVTLDEIHEAEKRIAGVAVRTSLVKLDKERARAAGFAIDEDSPAIWIKAENEQPIGSFKLRGAYNKVASLSEECLKRGVITYSSGNHAQGVAYAARAKGVKAVIVMPNTSPKLKQKKTAELGGEVVLVGPASKERRQKAEELEAEHGYSMVPPYDDRTIIAGAATCALEILEQRPSVGLILAPVGGGGLLSGTAAGAKLTSPGVKVFGVEPELAADAKKTFETGVLVELPIEETSRTIADGLRTQSLGDINFAHVLKFADGFITVTEEEIRTATRLLLLASEIVPEPSGVVALAGALYHWRELPRVDEIAVILSGGNLDPSLRAELLADEKSV